MAPSLGVVRSQCGDKCTVLYTQLSCRTMQSCSNDAYFSRAHAKGFFKGSKPASGARIWYTNVPICRCRATSGDVLQIALLHKLVLSLTREACFDTCNSGQHLSTPQAERPMHAMLCMGWTIVCQGKGCARTPFSSSLCWTSVVCTGIESTTIINPTRMIVAISMIVGPKIQQICEVNPAPLVPNVYPFWNKECICCLNNLRKT